MSTEQPNSLKSPSSKPLQNSMNQNVPNNGTCVPSLVQESSQSNSDSINYMSIQKPRSAPACLSNMEINPQVTDRRNSLKGKKASIPVKKNTTRWKNAKFPEPKSLKDSKLEHVISSKSNPSKNKAQLHNESEPNKTNTKLKLQQPAQNATGNESSSVKVISEPLPANNKLSLTWPFPNEILEMIVRKLNVRDLRRLCLVSQETFARFDPYLKFPLLNFNRTMEINTTKFWSECFHSEDWEWKWVIGVPCQNQESWEQVMEIEINSANWSSDMAKYFSKLQIGDIWKTTLPDHFNGVNVQDFISQISPNITSLTFLTHEFPHLDLNKARHRTKLEKFINQFTKLKEVYVSLNYYENQSCIEKLEQILKTFKPHVRILMKITNDHDIYFEKFDKLPNIKFFMEFGSEHMSSKYWCIYNTTVREVNINLNLYACDDYDAEELQGSLLEFSQYLTKLEISQMGRQYKLQLFNTYYPQTIWWKLAILKIHGYEHPLEVLKHCPKLRELTLEVDDDKCFFHNYKKTYKEALQEYFGNLSQLKELKFYYCNTVGFNYELQGYLRNILSRDTKISYE